MSTKSKELDDILNIMKGSHTQENARKLTDLLGESNIFIPAKMPSDTDPEILKHITANDGTPMPIPEGAQPQPCVLINKEGKRFFPIFTSEEELAKGKDFSDHPLTLNVPFKACMDIIVNAPNIDGAVINPFNQNVLMNVKRADKQPAANGEKVKVTEAQLHSVLRQQLEARELPMMLFKDGKKFIEDISEREGGVIMDLFNKLYEETNNCPYSTDDFDLMTLTISDTLQLIRITLPDKTLSVGNTSGIFITWNPVDESAKYFVIVHTPEEEPDRLLRVNPTGKSMDFGAAPEEGNELQYIITMASKL